MSSIVLVPIHLDALYLKYGQSVAEATADFSRLPYFNGTRDVNPNTVNLSESIVSQPFQNQNLYLKPGIHLHWALPDALTKGVQEAGEIKFPAVPNRWLVIRRQNSQATQKWVVESDYLHPPENGYQEDSVTYPNVYKHEDSRQKAPPFYKNKDSRQKAPPFFYLGRQLTWQKWRQQPQQSNAKYLSEITAIGYGEPTFAAFYPNCRSVFGFYDDPRSAPFSLEQGLEYDVIGWYSQPDQNYLNELVKQLKQTEQQNFKREPEVQEVIQFIEENLQWYGIELTSTNEVPQIICYSRLTFKPTNDPSKIDKQAQVSLAVGNTGSEALAAYLAQSINQNQKGIIEEQLALINLADSLDSDRPDFGAIFQQRQHQESFNGLSGGLNWRITVTTDSATATKDSASSSQMGLPQELMSNLYQLNEQQEEYNRSLEEIESMRYQLFSDWYKYMVSCYPPEDSWDNYPDIDEVKAYIENYGLEPLEAKTKEIGHLSVSLKEKDGSIAASAKDPNTLASKLARKINNLVKQIDTYNRNYNNYNQIELHLRLDRIVDGQVEDASGQNRNATQVGKPQIVSDERFGRCIKFQEKNDRLALGLFQKVSASTKITIEVWISTDATDKVTVKNLVVCQSSSSTTEEVFLRINQNEYQIGSALGEKNYASAPIIDADKSQWIHLAGVYNGKDWILYKNGREIARQKDVLNNSAIVQESWRKNWTIAADKDGGNCFQGKMAHLRLYHHALSAEEIQRSMDNLTRVTYKLEEIADSRYWQPKEPVVLILEDKKAAKVVKPTDRHGEDGKLQCTTLTEQTIERLIEQEFDSVVKEINKLQSKQQNKGEVPGFGIWKEQAWNPFLLEWLVEFFPAETADNNRTSGKAYPRNFLTANYILAEHAFEQSPKSAEGVPVSGEQDNRIRTAKDFNTYSGSSILTPYTSLLLQQRLKHFCEQHPESEKNTIDNPVYVAIAKCEQQFKGKKPRDRQIEAFIRARIPHNYPRYTKATKIDAEDFFSKPDNIEHLKSWYETHKLQTIPSLLHTVKQAQQQLEKLNCLSQSLGGFNAALLMHKQTLQLEIDDPIGFPDYRKFTDRVRKAVADSTTVAPQPLDRFNPIRAGEMRLIDLQLIDTFGQVKDLKWQQVIVPKTMEIVSKNRESEENERILLHPRLVQPARINFQWLPAEDVIIDDANSKKSPDSKSEATTAANPNPGTSQSQSHFTPICGWIIPNNLNENLIIYSTSGKALGSIEASGKWIDAPGSGLAGIERISNPHLKKVVEKICYLGKKEKEKDFVKHFRLVLSNALENIELGQLTQSNLLSLLVGRPIAVVRASVNLELQGFPAINQNWQAFRQDMQLGRKNERTESGNNIPQRGTDGFTAVEFPIRIGEYQQLSDGVIGYWKEKEKPKGDYEYEGDIFYAQQSDEVESEYIETQYCEPNINKDIGEGPINIIQTLDSPPQKLTLLIDPHHALHITAGILPTKVVTIPPEQYVPVLEAIEVPFLTSPILTHRDSYNLPLPKVPQYAWSWLEKKVQQWHEIYEFSTIDKAILLQEFPKQFPKVAPEAVWQLLIDAGWLKVMPNDPTKAAIVPQENRPKDDQGGQVKPLSGNLKTQGKEINQFLERHQMSLTSASSQASFAESLQIREGWLVLKKVNSPLAPHHPQTESLGLHKQSLPPQAQEL